MQQTTNTFSTILMCRNRMPLSRHFHRFFRIPNTHSTSFLTLSKLDEKYPSLVLSPAPLKGQTSMGQRTHHHISNRHQLLSSAFRLHRSNSTGSYCTSHYE
ncbi:hypothetical protein ACHAWF_010971 [Thalassiosira exigua]